MQGKVVDPAGCPVPGAAIVVASGTEPTGEISILSNAEGDFDVYLPSPGTYELHAHASHGRTGVTTVAMPTKKSIKIVVSPANA